MLKNIRMAIRIATIEGKKTPLQLALDGVENMGSPAAKSDWLAGYAACLADASRDGHDLSELFKSSGLTEKQFQEAGCDEYDLEEISKWSNTNE